MAAKSVFDPIIQKFGCGILDGGLATELESYGHNLNHPLWSGHILNNHPEDVQKVHESYLRSGANILLTSSYQLSYQGGSQVGLDKKEVNGLLARSVHLALAAKDKFLLENAEFSKEEILVGGSIGPYGAYLANGAEYTGKYDISEKELFDFHYKRYKYLDNSNVDLILFETIPSLAEVKAINRLVNAESQKNVVVSFSCRNGQQINDGSFIESCIEVLLENLGIVGLSINCTNPEFGKELIFRMKKRAQDKYLLIYPNSGESYSSSTKTWSGQKAIDDFTSKAKLWREAGADIIGGCCRIGPKHIQALSKELHCNF